MRSLPGCSAVMLLCLGISLTTVASASPAVPAADLAVLSEQQLVTLKDSEFEALKAEVELARARGAESMAKTRLAEAKQKLKVEELDLKAAKAEAKAVSANQRFGQGEKASPAMVAEQQASQSEVATRASVVETKLQQAQRENDRARAFVDWKDADVEARGLDLEAAELALELAEFERDSARLTVLREADPAAAAKYARLDLATKQAKLAERLARTRAKLETAKARQGTTRGAYEAIPTTTESQP